jgi:hypothetical protein
VHDDAVPLELLPDERTEFGVDRGKDIGKLLDDGHGEPARPQGLRHLEPDVAGADDDRGLGRSRQRFVQDEAVADGVQLKDAVSVEAGDRRTEWLGSGRDHQLVVLELVFPAVGVGCGECSRTCVDPLGRVL